MQIITIRIIFFLIFAKFDSQKKYCPNKKYTKTQKTL